MYQKFVNNVMELLQEVLSDDYLVSIQETTKNNDLHRCGISIREKGNIISPVIYMEEYFARYQSGWSLKKIVDDVLRVYEDSKLKSWDINMITDFSIAKNKLMMKLINLEGNKKYLKNVPYIPFHDLAIVFYVLVDSDEDENATVLVREDMLKMWNVTKETIFEIAKENTPKMLPYSFKSMFDTLSELSNMVFSKDCGMYVLTNQPKTFGASAILYDGVLAEIRNALGENFYALPSSIHEWIIVRESFAPSGEDLNMMIQEINTTQVDADEILGNHCYYYGNGELQMR